MAIVKGVFTSISGKLGNTIYCKSGSNQVIKSGFVPHNPKSQSQVSDRSLFATINTQFKILNDDIIQPFWKPFMRKNKKAWSSFISSNKKSMVDVFDVRKAIITKGSLEGVQIYNVEFNEISKTLDIYWNTNTIQNGNPDDDISFVIFDHVYQHLIAYDLKCAIRSDNHYLFTSIDDFSGNNLTIFAFASIDSASGLKIVQVSSSTSFDIDPYLLVMSFIDNASDTSSIQLKDVDGNACKVDFGDGKLQDISTISETESLIVPSFIKIYSLNGLSYFKSSNNNFSFSLSDLPSSLTYFYCTGSNTINGSLSDLPSSLTYFYCTGSNTINGSLSDLPSVLTYFLCTGSNTISGSLSALPSFLLTFRCSGSNTISGSLSDLPLSLTTFRCSGSNTISGYSLGHVFSNNFQYILSLPSSGSGLDSSEVDNLLIDLSQVPTWSGSKIVNIAGNNAARTSASDSAVAILVSKGVSVTTN